MRYYNRRKLSSPTNIWYMHKRSIYSIVWDCCRHEMCFVDANFETYGLHTKNTLIRLLDRVSLEVWINKKEKTTEYCIWLAGNVCMSNIYLSIEYANSVTLMLDWWLFKILRRICAQRLFHQHCLREIRPTFAHAFCVIRDSYQKTFDHCIDSIIANKWTDSIRYDHTIAVAQNVLFQQKKNDLITINIC